jgi:hypothetical protein
MEREMTMKCVNTTEGGIPALSGQGQTKVLAVLTQDDRGLYAVYVGLVSSDDRYKNRNISEVMKFGAKLTLRRARFFFPDLVEAQYRA